MKEVQTKKTNKMIQMRENRYDDIRTGVVYRSSEGAAKTPAKNANESKKSAAAQQRNELDPRANQPDEYLDDEEYNSWS
jgi:hypothetical protein